MSYDLCVLICEYLRSNMSPKFVRERMKYNDNTSIITCGTDCVCVWCVCRMEEGYRRRGEDERRR